MDYPFLLGSMVPQSFHDTLTTLRGDLWSTPKTLMKIELLRLRAVFVKFDESSKLECYFFAKVTTAQKTIIACLKAKSLGITIMVLFFF